MSPGLISDTPSGVPVMRMSPGSIVMYRVTYETRNGREKIMFDVFPDCLTSPLTVSSRSRS